MKVEYYQIGGNFDLPYFCYLLGVACSRLALFCSRW
jgi:hypothetical protein